MRLRVLQAIAMIAITFAGPAAAQSGGIPVEQDDAMTLHTFLLTYRCAVVERLQMIHDNRDRKRDRFIVLAMRLRPQSYVQCIFLDGDRRVLCEASSGFYATPAVQDRSYRLPEYRVAALARLGFSTDDSEGNFQKLITFDGEPDLAVIADLILSTLYEVYDARIGSNLEWVSPLADIDPRKSACVPIG
ncbi:MAG: hypothetical protein R3D30_07310 [Hyphomicrobiales bacterium]